MQVYNRPYRFATSKNFEQFIHILKGGSLIKGHSYLKFQKNNAL